MTLEARVERLEHMIQGLSVILCSKAIIATGDLTADEVAIVAKDLAEKLTELQEAL
jgi:hypothetical protein